MRCAIDRKHHRSVAAVTECVNKRRRRGKSIENILSLFTICLLFLLVTLLVLSRLASTDSIIPCWNENVAIIDKILHGNSVI